MKTAIVSFSVAGASLGKKILSFLLNDSDEKFNGNLEIEAVTTNERAEDILPRLNVPLSEWVGMKFVRCDLIIFVGACGIAVRKIAPYIADKKTDPAVIVIDDTGKNVISLLSGHLGGANEWALYIAEKLDANPVITTASDCSGKIAVDMFAKNNELIIDNYKLAKEVESALLDGEKISFESEFETEGSLPDGFVTEETEATTDYKVRVGLHNIGSCEKTLYLIPKCVVVGIGCKRGKTKDDILKAVCKCLEQADIPIESIYKICSIDLKKDETGLLEAAQQLIVQTAFYTAKELMKAEGISWKSEFVKEITGVDNVCERAAIIGSGNGKIVFEKTKVDGVTVAFAIDERSISFE